MSIFSSAMSLPLPYRVLFFTVLAPIAVIIGVVQAVGIKARNMFRPRGGGYVEFLEAVEYNHKVGRKKY